MGVGETFAQWKISAYTGNISIHHPVINASSKTLYVAWYLYTSSKNSVSLIIQNPLTNEIFLQRLSHVYSVNGS